MMRFDDDDNNNNDETNLLHYAKFLSQLASLVDIFAKLTT